MKKLYALLPLLFLLTTLQAQLDTVLFEDFQVNPFDDMDTLVTGDNTNWANIDQDGMETAFGTEESKQWFWGEFFIDPTDPNTGQTNFIATSLSFLEGSMPGNRNWMILPPVDITDDSYMLHWESAPAQMPRYMDGYIVLVSTGINELHGNNFSDTLFLAASMDQITGSGQSTDYSNFTFTEGYLHADGGTIPEYVYDDGSGTILRGLLEPHSVSLADYVGETIYIAFLHNSDDDERIGLDDILITRGGASNTNESMLQQLRMEVYPNPANHLMNLNFRLTSSADVEWQLFSATGELLRSQQMGTLPSGFHQVKLRLDQVAAGNYFIQLKVGEDMATTQFIKSN